MITVDHLESLVVLYHRHGVFGRIEHKEPDRDTVGVAAGTFPAALDWRNRRWRRAVDRAGCQGNTAGRERL